MMMATKHKIETLNDLNIMTYQLFKTLDLERTYNEPCLEIWRKYVPSMTMNEMKEAHRNQLTINDICEMNELTQEQIVEMSDAILNVRKNCKYNEFVCRAVELRNRFLSTRDNYFMDKATISFDTEDSKDPLNVLTDILLGTWIEKTLHDIYPHSIDITYETETGKVISTRIAQKKLDITEESIEAPPIDRWIGVTWVDSFFYKGFWDCKNRRWIRIPITLIIDMSSDHVEELQRRSFNDPPAFKSDSDDE